jgi:hypothetical protein
MAERRTITVEYVDDLDGSVVDEADVSTVAFSYKGTSYEIDLKPANAKKLDDALNKYIAAARKTSNGRRGRAASTATRPSTGSGRSKEELAAIRSWAIDEGYEISPRGRIKAEIIEAYDAASK